MQRYACTGSFAHDVGMRTWWGHLRASRYAGWLFGLLAVGVVLWIGALVVKAVSTEDQGLQRLANQAQVVGVALAVIPLVLNAIIGLWQRLRGVPIQRDPGELLAIRVRLVEEQARHALLGDATAANLTFSAGDMVRQHAPQPDPGMLERLRRLVRYRPEFGGPEADLASIADFYSDLQPRRLVILGDPGSGKTVLAIELILQLLARLGDREGLPGGAVPVRASLAGWDPSRQLEDWLAERLTVDYQLAPASAKVLIQERRVLPVLDGLDEMDPDPSPTQAGQPPARALLALAKLNTYFHGSQRAAVVLTCRQHRYSQVEQIGAGLRDATRIRILPLDAEQIRGYLTSRFSDSDHLKAWQPVLNALDGATGEAAREVLSTPWRLHLATAVAQVGWSPAEQLLVTSDNDPGVTVRRIERVASDRLCASCDPAGRPPTTQPELRSGQGSCLAAQPRRPLGLAGEAGRASDQPTAWPVRHRSCPPSAVADRRLAACSLPPHHFWLRGLNGRVHCLKHSNHRTADDLAGQHPTLVCGPRYPVPAISRRSVLKRDTAYRRSALARGTVP